MPAKLSKDELVDLLKMMVTEIEQDDSFEGSIEYSCLDEQCDRGEFMVRASIRVGNRNGQGGVTLVGVMTNDPTSDASAGHAEADADAAEG